MENNEQKRGQISDRIKFKSKELLGYEIGKIELRLMAYIQYVMCNEQTIERSKLHDEEKPILKKWEVLKFIFIENNYYDIRVTKEFWNIICEIIYLGYVDLEK